jgi:hypothetical protein
MQVRLSTVRKYVRAARLSTRAARTSGYGDMSAKLFRRESGPSVLARHNTFNSTSMLPRVAFEYGHTWWAASTNC